jgi:prophage tail gpP-like protein
MADTNRATIELRFADGDPITTWETFTLRQNYIDPLDDFQLTVSNPAPAKRDSYLSRLSKGERVTLWANGAQQATCEIVTVSGKISRTDGWTLSIGAKSTLHAAFQGGADPHYGKNLTADTPVRDVILDVLGPYGFNSIVLDTASDVGAISGKSLQGRAPAVALNEVKLKDFQTPNKGDMSAYQYCASLFTRFGLVLRTDRQGELLLGVPDFDQAAAYTVEQDRFRFYDGDLMIGEIGWTDTNDGQHSHYVVRGGKDESATATSATSPTAGVIVPGYSVPSGAPFSKVSLEELRPGRHLYRSARSPYKPKFWRDEKSLEVARALSFARSMSAQRGASGFQVKCTVDGLVSRTKRIWTVDTVGRVVVGDIGLDENMWLLETVKSGARNGGQHTELTWIPLHSLDLRSS